MAYRRRSLNTALMLPVPLVILLLIITSHYYYVVTGYKHKPCNNRRIRSQFQFDDCFVPDQNPNLDISSASFLLAHNAATVYIQRNSLSKAGLSWWYSKNQFGGSKNTAYQLLNDGARALDLRPKYVNSTTSTGDDGSTSTTGGTSTTGTGTVIFQHGDVNIPTTYEQLVADVVEWCNDNPTELVLLLPSHFAYYGSGTSNNDDKYYSMMAIIQDVYQKYDITYLSCQDIYGLTVGEIMELSTLPNDGGYLVAIDGQDGYSSCVKENWIENQLVTCYDKQLNVSCKQSTRPFTERLVPYMMQSMYGEPTDDQYTLGPPEDLETWPFNEIQGLWQVDTHAAVEGMRRVSSILEDNRQSNINYQLVNWIYDNNIGFSGEGGGNGDDNNDNDGTTATISLLAVDNVALHGNALLSVLRNTCGQSSINGENGNDEEACGTNVPKPKMIYYHVEFKYIVYGIVILYAIVSICVHLSSKKKGYLGSGNIINNNNNNNRPKLFLLWNTLLSRIYSSSISSNPTTTTVEPPPPATTITTTSTTKIQHDDVVERNHNHQVVQDPSSSLLSSSILASTTSSSRREKLLS